MIQREMSTSHAWLKKAIPTFKDEQVHVVPQLLFQTRSTIANNEDNSDSAFKIKI